MGPSSAVELSETAPILNITNLLLIPMNKKYIQFNIVYFQRMF